MRLPVYCIECARISGSSPEILGGYEMRDDGRYEVNCSAGHRTVAILQEHLYELLFEMGLYAIKDGYYRDAVASFSASYERFHEVAIRTILISQGKNEAHIDACWKRVSAQSERQLGAFLFVWAMKFDDPPELVSENVTKFRNDVVHKGKIPSRSEALKFGDDLFRMLKAQISRLQDKMPDAVVKAAIYNVRAQRRGLDPKLVTSNCAIPTLLGGPASSGGIEDYLNSLSKWW